MAQVRAPKGTTVVARYCGRRLRVSDQWTEIDGDDAVERLLAECPDLEVKKGSKPKPAAKPKVEKK